MIVEAEQMPLSAEKIDLQVDLDELQLPKLMVTCPMCGGVGDAVALGGETRAERCVRCNGAGKVEQYTVTNLSEAIKVGRKIQAIEAWRAQQVEAWREEILRLQALIDASNKRADQQRSFWDNLLTFFHRSILALTPKAKTVDVLPGLKLVARSGEKWHYDDEKLATYLRAAAPHLVRVSYAPDKSALKKESTTMPDGNVVLSATGEVIGGVKVSVETSFSVKCEP